MGAAINFMQWMYKIKSNHYTNTEAMDRAINRLKTYEEDRKRNFKNAK